PVPYSPVSLLAAKGAGIGWFEDDGAVPVTPETRNAVRAAARELEKSGFALRPHRPEGLDEALRLWRIFFLQCGEMFYEEVIQNRREELSPVFQEFLSEASAERPLTAMSLLQAWAETDRLRMQFLTQMQGLSLLLLPVCSIPAFRHGERSWTMEGRDVGYWDAMRFTQWFNLLALPAAVVPVGQSPEGLPIGVQVVGRPYQDELVLAVAGVLDQAFGYRIPPHV
ncbi:MAG: amidase, partial [Rhodospirillales bacterium]|nr:amidase [Acetobacter sp.]